MFLAVLLFATHVSSNDMMIVVCDRFIEGVVSFFFFAVFDILVPAIEGVPRNNHLFAIDLDNSTSYFRELGIGKTLGPTSRSSFVGLFKGK